MKTRTRVVSALLTALLLGGPLAPLAWAQQPSQPGPDLFQEALKAEQKSGGQKSVYDAGAVVVNVFLVPGRAITCLGGSVLGLVLLGATLGSGYHAATAAVNEGCGGKWVVTGEDLQSRPDSQWTHLEMEGRR
jgi:hypothetical protein